MNNFSKILIFSFFILLSFKVRGQQDKEVCTFLGDTFNISHNETVPKTMIKLVESISRKNYDKDMKSVIASLQKDKQINNLYKKLSKISKSRGFDDYTYTLFYKTCLDTVFSDINNSSKNLLIFYFLMKDKVNSALLINRNNQLLIYNEFFIDKTLHLYNSLGHTYKGEKYYSFLNETTNLDDHTGYTITAQELEKKAKYPLILHYNLPYLENLDNDTIYYSVDYKGSNYKFYHIVNQNILSYLDNHIDLNRKYNLYYNLHNTSILNQLDTILNKYNSREDKINFIKQFVLSNLKYEFEDENNPVEHFPDQILYYMKGDCEEFAILISYLIKHLLPREEVYMMNFETHLSAAVGKEVENSSPIKYKGKTYYLLDYTSTSGLQKKKIEGIITFDGLR